MPVHLTIDADSQRAQKAGILAMLSRAAPAVVKAAGQQLAQTAVDRISGQGTIRRVDTTRYRGSIGAAALQATGQAPSGAPLEAVQEGDAFGDVQTWNTGASLRMSTSAPYASYLEWGTVQMRAGYHLTGAAQQGRQAIHRAAWWTLDTIARRAR